MSEIQKLLYSVQETGAMVSLSPRTFYNNVSLARKGKVEYLIKPRYQGRRPLFHIDDIKAFAASLPAEPQVKRKPRLKNESP